MNKCNYNETELIPTMYKNYENRVINFIEDMADPETQIIINNFNKKIETSRSLLMSETPTFYKTFINKGYTTERDLMKQKITNTIKANHLHNRTKYNIENKKKGINTKKKCGIKSNSPTSNSLINPLTKTTNSLQWKISTLRNNDLTKPFSKTVKYNSEPSLLIKRGGRILSKKEQELIDYHIKNDIILQPEMRFKARNDLERIYEALFENYSKIHLKKLIEKQIKSIDVFNCKRPKDFLKDNYKPKNDENEQKEENNDLRNPFMKNLKKKIDSKKNKSKTYYVKKDGDDDKKYWIKKEKLNADAGEILKSYKYKTHFKAVEEIAENKKKSKKNNNDNQYISLLPNLFKKKEYSNSSNRIYRNEFCELDFHDIDTKKDEESYRLYNSFHYKNPIKRIKHYRPDLIKQLSEIAFHNIDNKEKKKDMKNNNDINNEFETMSHFHKRCKIDDSEIQIDGRIYNKKEESDLIAQKILKICGLYTDKNKKFNQYLGTGNEKNSFTNGTMINRLKKIYKLKNK